MELVEVGIAAFSGELRVIPPDPERCLDDLPPNSIYLTDIPENQMGMAIVRECRRRLPTEKANTMSQSFLFRWLALTRAKSVGMLDPFVKKLPQGAELINDAIFAAAAECPLDENGYFGEAYVERIRKILNERGETS